jgi:hypothetical protein
MVVLKLTTALVPFVMHASAKALPGDTSAVVTFELMGFLF